VSYLSNKNFSDSISGDDEQDELIKQLLIYPVTSDDFSEEFIP